MIILLSFLSFQGDLVIVNWAYFERDAIINFFFNTFVLFIVL